MRFHHYRTHHDTPEVWIGARPLAEYLDRFVVGKTEHPIFTGKVLEHRLTHADQDWGDGLPWCTLYGEWADATGAGVVFLCCTPTDIALVHY